MSILRIKSPPLSETKKEGEEEPKKNKSAFFYKDKHFRKRDLEEAIKRDPDLKAFYRDKW